MLRGFALFCGNPPKGGFPLVDPQNNYKTGTHKKRTTPSAHVKRHEKMSPQFEEPLLQGSCNVSEFSTEYSHCPRRRGDYFTLPPTLRRAQASAIPAAGSNSAPCSDSCLYASAKSLKKAALSSLYCMKYFLKPSWLTLEGEQSLNVNSSVGIYHSTTISKNVKHVSQQQPCLHLDAAPDPWTATAGPCPSLHRPRAGSTP